LFNTENIIKISAAVLIIAIVSYFAFYNYNKWQQSKLNDSSEVEQQETEKLRQKVADLQDEIALNKTTVFSEQKHIEAFGDNTDESSFQDSKLDCEKIKKDILSLCLYLDKKEYIKAFNLNDGIYIQFQEMIQQLSSSLPVITGETDNFLNLMRNISHFYRILGIRQVELIKAIIENESEIIESVMKISFAWISSCALCNKEGIGCPPFNIFYTYSGFFLNTLAGRSYLLRRDSKVRKLVLYYCVLTLDMANDQNLNVVGIDIKPYIYIVIDDIKNQKGLIFHNEYVAKLEKLMLKYNM